MRPATGPLLALAALWALSGAAGAQDPPDLFTEDLQRCAWLCASPVEELRLEGVQRLSWLKHCSGEPLLLARADDPSAAVRRDVAFALGRVGRGDSIPVLLRLLGDADSGVREHARLSLQLLTQMAEPTAEWWQGTSPDGIVQEALRLLDSADAGERVRGLRLLRCFASPEAEARVLAFVTTAQPPADGTQQWLAVEVLERIGTPAALPYLEAVVEQQPGAAWALGQIGAQFPDSRPAAEEALLRGLRRFGVWDPQHLTNLDRLHSTRCGELVPLMVDAYGAITYRGQPENLAYDPTPLQRACTNLILRSGRGPEVVEAVLRELEGRAVDAEIAEDLRPQMVRLRDELLPGFVRNDGVTTSHPLSAMAQLIRDRRLAPRLVPLLQHPAFVPRVYAAMALGRLEAVEALPAIVDLVEEGYPFADQVTAVSGKHFGDSQSVRWRGFLCMGLGRMGGDEARLELERLASDPGQYRDIRFGAVVGLGFIGSPASLPVLHQVAQDDIIWRTRMEAQDVVHRIELAEADAAGRQQ